MALHRLWDSFGGKKKTDRKHKNESERLSPTSNFVRTTNTTEDSLYTEVNDPSEIENCVICMDDVSDPVALGCGHVFCKDCIEQQFQHKKACPTCGAVCRTITGDQPSGTMDVTTNHVFDCAGYKGCGRIVIQYDFPSGYQQSHHPSPSKYYKGITRTAYLPDNNEGRQICEMLKVAFERKLVFTIGRSRTTGQEGVIIWNDIHHKTDYKPNTQFGYPDPTYLDRVRDELAAKGVTEKDIVLHKKLSIQNDSVSGAPVKKPEILHTYVAIKNIPSDYTLEKLGAALFAARIPIAPPVLVYVNGSTHGIAICRSTEDAIRLVGFKGLPGIRFKPQEKLFLEPTCTIKCDKNNKQFILDQLKNIHVTVHEKRDNQLLVVAPTKYQMQFVKDITSGASASHIKYQNEPDNIKTINVDSKVWDFVKNVKNKNYQVLEDDGNVKVNFEGNIVTIDLSGAVLDDEIRNNVEVLDAYCYLLQGKEIEEIHLDRYDEDETQKWCNEVEEILGIPCCLHIPEQKILFAYGDSLDDLRKVKHIFMVKEGTIKPTGRRKRNIEVSKQPTASGHTDYNRAQSDDLSEVEIAKHYKGHKSDYGFNWNSDAKNVKAYETREGMIVKVYEASIVKLPVDCIVNAANDNLQHGGGIARVIEKAAGYELTKDGQKYIDKNGRIPVGLACTTTAGRLPYKCVIHAVGPRWGDYWPYDLKKVHEVEHDLHSAITNSFYEAENRELDSIAVPAISAAIFAVPEELCVYQYARAIVDYSKKSTTAIRPLREIHFIDINPSIIRKIQNVFKVMIEDGIQPNYDTNTFVKSHQSESKSKWYKTKLDNKRDVKERSNTEQNATIKNKYYSESAERSPLSTIRCTASITEAKKPADDTSRVPTLKSTDPHTIHRAKEDISTAEETQDPLDSSFVVIKDEDGASGLTNKYKRKTDQGKIYKNNDIKSQSKTDHMRSKDRNEDSIRNTSMVSAHEVNYPPSVPEIHSTENLNQSPKHNNKPSVSDKNKITERAEIRAQKYNEEGKKKIMTDDPHEERQSKNTPPLPPKSFKPRKTHDPLQEPSDAPSHPPRQKHAFTTQNTFPQTTSYTEILGSFKTSKPDIQSNFGSETIGLNKTTNSVVQCASSSDMLDSIKTTHSFVHGTTDSDMLGSIKTIHAVVQGASGSDMIGSIKTTHTVVQGTTDSDLLGSITTIQPVALNTSDSSDDEENIQLDTFEVVIRCKKRSGGYSTLMLKSHNTEEALKWRYIFSSNQHHRVTQKLGNVCKLINFRMDSNVAEIECENNKPPVIKERVKTIVTQETIDLRVTDFRIETEECQRVVDVLTRNCPVFTDQTVSLFMESARCYLVSPAGVFEANIEIFQQTRDFFSTTLGSQASKRK